MSEPRRHHRHEARSSHRKNVPVSRKAVPPPHGVPVGRPAGIPVGIPVSGSSSRKRPAAAPRPRADRRPPLMHRIVRGSILVVLGLLLLIGCFEFGLHILSNRRQAHEARLKKQPAAPVQVAAATPVKKAEPPPSVEKKTPTPERTPAPAPPKTEPKAAPQAEPKAPPKTEPRDPPKMEAKDAPKMEAKDAPKTEPKVPPKTEPKPPAPPPAKPPTPPPPRNEQPQVAKLTYEKHVLPIFNRRCLNCHGGSSMKGDLDLRTLKALSQGGTTGPGVKPGDPKESILWQRIADNSMPPGKNKLTAEERKTIQDWILGGAKGNNPNARAAKP